MTLTTDEVTTLLRLFKARRDSMLHEDAHTFYYHFQRFVEFCQGNPLVQSILAPPQRVRYAILMHGGLIFAPLV